MFQVFANCPEDMGPREIGARALRAEAMGYDGLQVPDALHDGLLLSAMALAATSALLVGTGVLLAFPRSPMVTAIAAWDLQKMSGGRFELAWVLKSSPILKNAMRPGGIPRCRNCESTYRRLRRYFIPFKAGIV